MFKMFKQNNMFYGGVMGRLYVVHRTMWEGTAIVVVDEETRRSLHFGSHLQQSAMLLDDPDTLILNYTRQMMAMLLLHAAPRRGLMLGLGGGSMPRFLLRHFPDLVMDVVEIAPPVVEVARNYFMLPQDGRLRIHLEEGGKFVAEAPRAMGRYDLLLVDAFDGKGMAASVRAGAFFQSCLERLAPGGVMALNMTCGSQPSRCRELAQAMAGVFLGETLRLTVEGTNNQILFAVRGGLKEVDWSGWNTHAGLLEGRTGLPFESYAQNLLRENTLLLRRRGIWPVG